MLISYSIQFIHITIQISKNYLNNKKFQHYVDKKVFKNSVRTQIQKIQNKSILLILFNLFNGDFFRYPFKLCKSTIFYLQLIPNDKQNKILLWIWKMLEIGSWANEIRYLDQLCKSHLNLTHMYPMNGLNGFYNFILSFEIYLYHWN